MYDFAQCKYDHIAYMWHVDFKQGNAEPHIDAFLQAKSGSGKKIPYEEYSSHTTSFRNCLAPKWNEKFHFGVHSDLSRREGKELPLLSINLIHHKTMGSKIPMGAVELDLDTQIPDNGTHCIIATHIFLHSFVFVWSLVLYL